MFRSEGEWKLTATAKTSARVISTQQQYVDKIVEENKYIFVSPTGVPFHYQVKHSIDLTLNSPLPNGSIYRCYVMENEEIKCRINKCQQLCQSNHDFENVGNHG
jgi:hypothetical protein